MLTLIEDIIIQSEPGKQDKIRFLGKVFTTYQILISIFLIASDFELKSQILENFFFKKARF